MSSDTKTQRTLLQDINLFCPHYYATIQQAFLMHCKNAAAADDLTQDFLMDKIVTGGLLSKYLEKTRQEEIDCKPRTSFRNYLHCSIRHFWYSEIRKDKRKAIKPVDAPIVNLPAPVEESETFDPDMLYAFAILNRALHKVRQHCRKKGMESHWIIFEELVLARFDDQRTPRSREELREEFFPGEDSNQKLDNALTSVKRMVRRSLDAIFMREPYEGEPGRSPFDVWMEILKGSNASMHSVLQAALRVTGPGSGGGPLSRNESLKMIGEPDPEEIAEKELAFAVSFRLSLPIIEWTEWEDPSELMNFLPSPCPFLPNNKRKDIRPLTLGMLMAPTAEESAELDRFKVAEILHMVKDLSRQYANQMCHPVDRKLFKLVYALTVTIARIQFGEIITSLDVETQQSNIRWYRDKPWVDDEIKAFFKKALTTIGVWYQD